MGHGLIFTNWSQILQGIVIYIKEQFEGVLHKNMSSSKIRTTLIYSIYEYYFSKNMSYLRKIKRKKNERKMKKWKIEKKEKN